MEIVNIDPKLLKAYENNAKEQLMQKKQWLIFNVGLISRQSPYTKTSSKNITRSKNSRVISNFAFNETGLINTSALA